MSNCTINPRVRILTPSTIFNIKNIRIQFSNSRLINSYVGVTTFSDDLFPAESPVLNEIKFDSRGLIWFNKTTVKLPWH